MDILVLERKQNIYFKKHKHKAMQLLSNYYVTQETQKQKAKPTV